MFFEALIRNHTNPSYRINHNRSSNIRTVVFEKDDKRYEYHFLMSSAEEYLLINLKLISCLFMDLKKLKRR